MNCLIHLVSSTNFKLQLNFNIFLNVIYYNFNYFSRDYEDIRCEEADQVILERVKAGEEINLPNGKLLERLLTIKLYRESKYMYSSRILYYH